MLPYATLISIKKESKIPIYLQISNSFISLIKKGILQKGSALPGTRALSEILNIHRNTVIAAYQELSIQGWIVIKPSEGTSVSNSLPEVNPRSLKNNTGRSSEPIPGYMIRSNPFLNTNIYIKSSLLELNDGLPDPRLAPMDSLARTIRSVLKGQRGKNILSYSSIEGNQCLRTELAKYLSETRGFDVKTENIFITRGSINALYLCCQVLLEKGDNVIVAELGYRGINLIVEQLGANLLKVPIDDQGLCIESIERICKKKAVRAIYVTPHHHYPTTVTMPPERRIALLALAEKYKVAILEDDYDYDFHYQHSPFLPLASADPAGMVIYIGSFSKTISPAFRVGYIAAPKILIHEVAKMRRIIDRQGDNVLEQALAELLDQGEIEALLRKIQKEYHKRRDFFCQILKERLGDFVQFKIPEGGLAVWTHFDTKIPLERLRESTNSLGLYITDGSYFNQQMRGLNATRLGFASLNIEELEKAVDLLEAAIKSIK